MKDRITYEVDPHNQLIVKKSGKPSGVKKFRKVIKGRFKTDTKNNLSYEVVQPSGSDTPQKIRFSGKYSLDKKHNLVFTLDKWGDQYAGNRLRLKTGIIDAGGSEIVFLVNSKLSKDKRYIYPIKLHGAWQADENNRLIFGVQKEGEKPDDLKFLNAWKIGKDNEIQYVASRKSGVITLKGSWCIRDKCRIGYVLDKEVDSDFDFKASLGSIIPRKEETYLKFDITIDVSGGKRIRRSVVFTGTLKPGKGRYVTLEVAPGKEKNIKLKLTRDMLEDRGFSYLEGFVRGRERYAGGGIALKW